jgi:Rod binding domain-containing protein
VIVALPPNPVPLQPLSGPSGGISQPVSVQQSAQQADPPVEQKLRKAAAEFESMLLSSLWKSMKSSFASPDDDASDPAHETLDDWGMQAMSSAVGRAGGLGIGKLILKHLEPLLSQHGNTNARKAGKASGLPADVFYESR